jgi:hypothetical protein
VSATLEGEVVVDLWAGHRDSERTQPFERDTLVNVYSTTKGLTAIALHRLVDEGLVDLDAPVARYWPEFAQAGKEKLPVRYLLSHEAGLPAVKKPLPFDALFDWNAMTSALAEQEPWWEPGRRTAITQLTFGWLVGEVVRRVRGRRSATWCATRSRGRSARSSRSASVPSSTRASLRSNRARSIRRRTASTSTSPRRSRRNPESVLAKAFANPPALTPGLVNTRAWRGAEIPGAKRALQRAFARAHLRAARERRQRIRRAPALARGDRPRAHGADERTRRGAAAGDAPRARILPPTPEEPLGPNPRAVRSRRRGWLVQPRDPEHRLSFGYAMNLMHMGTWLVDPRARRLLAATYASL